jgi:iron complex outermembrane receptor protein
MPTSGLKFSGSYSLLRMQLKSDGNIVEGPFQANGNSPQHQVRFQSSVNLPRRLEANVAVRGVGELPNQHVPAYAQVDTSLAWRAFESGDLSLGVQNLLNDHHWEFQKDEGGKPSLPKRSVYGKVTWRF